MANVSAAVVSPPEFGAVAIFSRDNQIESLLLIGRKNRPHAGAGAFSQSVVSRAHIGADRLILISHLVDDRTNSRGLLMVETELAVEHIEIVGIAGAGRR